MNRTDQIRAWLKSANSDNSQDRAHSGGLVYVDTH